MSPSVHTVAFPSRRYLSVPIMCNCWWISRSSKKNPGLLTFCLWSHKNRTKQNESPPNSKWVLIFEWFLRPLTKKYELCSLPIDLVLVSDLGGLQPKSHSIVILDFIISFIEFFSPWKQMVIRSQYQKHHNFVPTRASLGSLPYVNHKRCRKIKKSTK
jgi:hypothetical protein